MSGKGTAEGGALTARRPTRRENALDSRPTGVGCGKLPEMSMLESLRDSRFLSGLTATEAEMVGEACIRKSFRRGETVLLEGDSAGAVRLLLNGAISLYRTSYDGKEQILRIVRSGDAFHDTAIFDECASLFSAQALAPSLVCTIFTNDLQRLMRASPRFTVNVAGLLAQEARHYLSLVEDLSFKDVPGRLAKVLLEYHASAVDSDPIRLTQQDMASMTGTVREMIARSLKIMEDHGIIRLNRRRISIVRMDVLRELAAVGRWRSCPGCRGDDDTAPVAGS